MCALLSPLSLLADVGERPNLRHCFQKSSLLSNLPTAPVWLLMLPIQSFTQVCSPEREKEPGATRIRSTAQREPWPLGPIPTWLHLSEMGIWSQMGFYPLCDGGRPNACSVSNYDPGLSLPSSLIGLIGWTEGLSNCVKRHFDLGLLTLPQGTGRWQQSIQTKLSFKMKPSLENQDLRGKKGPKRESPKQRGLRMKSIYLQDLLKMARKHCSRPDQFFTFL